MNRLAGARSARPHPVEGRSFGVASERAAGPLIDDRTCPRTRTTRAEQDAASSLLLSIARRREQSGQAPDRGRRPRPRHAPRSASASWPRSRRRGSGVAGPGTRPRATSLRSVVAFRPDLLFGRARARLDDVAFPNSVARPFWGPVIAPSQRQPPGSPGKRGSSSRRPPRSPRSPLDRRPDVAAAQGVEIKLAPKGIRRSRSWRSGDWSICLR
jgi:hypothetical protein